jgi:type II secretory pathway pseudopilin PulG
MLLLRNPISHAYLSPVNRMTKLLPTVLAAVLVLGFTGIPFARQKDARDTILVAGNPTLTQKRVDELQRFFEWILTAEFDANQLARFQKILIEGWKRDANRSEKFFNIFEDMAHKVESLPPEQRAEVLPDMQKSFLESIQANEASKLNQLLREVYQQARAQIVPEDSGSSSKSEVGGEPSRSFGTNDLVGEWSTNTQGFSLFRNSAKDIFANAGSSIRSFKISADGRVEFATFFTQSLSTCVTKIYRTSVGKMNVSGDRITIDYAPGKVQSQNNCDNTRNYTKMIEAERQVFTYTLEPFNNSLRLCLSDADNASYCVYEK